MRRSIRSRSLVSVVTLALLAALTPAFSGVALAATTTIQMEPVSGDRLFAPQSTSINQGDTITWQNVNGTHDIVSANIPAGAASWASPVVSGTGSFSRTFTVAGNYRYYCSIHSSAGEANTTPQDPSKMVGQFDVIADVTPPDAPTSLTATAASGSQIDLSWTPSASADAASQELFRNTANDRGTASLIQTFADNTTASHADAGLTAATTYYYWLETIDLAGNRSAPATATGATSSVDAQVDTQQTVLFDVSTTLQLTVTPASIDFGTVSAAAPSTTTVGATVANVKSNAGWTLAVKSIGANGTDESPGDDAVFTSGSNTVPVDRMAWRVNPDAVTAGTDAYTSVSDVDATITNSGIGTADAGTDTYLQYQLTAQFSDPPGINYSTVLLFTATSP